MKARNIRFLSVFLICFHVLSCNDLNQSSELTPCPADIAKRALDHAIEYSNAGTKYEFGGQDMLRAIKIDCSGLVVNCYYYAVTGTNYYLPFHDAAVINFYNQWSVATVNPRPGDLIFMGDDRSKPSHMGFFVRKKGGNIYFVDSTLKAEENIDGVSERYYPENDGRFLSFGVLLLNPHL
jgi:hypothetical protein